MRAHEHSLPEDDIPRPLKRMSTRLLWAAGVIVAFSTIGGALVWSWRWTPIAIRAEAEAAHAQADTANARLMREVAYRIAADAALRDSLSLALRNNEKALRILTTGSVLWTESKDSEEYRDAVRRLRRMRTFTLNP